MHIQFSRACLAGTIAFATFYYLLAGLRTTDAQWISFVFSTAVSLLWCCGALWYAQRRNKILLPAGPFLMWIARDERPIAFSAWVLAYLASFIVLAALVLIRFYPTIRS